MYFTSWDANVFLCLLTIFPDEIVRIMIKTVKKTHEDYVRLEAIEHYCNLIPYILYYNDMYVPTPPIQELKSKWRWSCPEKRRENLVRWTHSDRDLELLKYEKIPSNSGEGTCRAGCWNSGEAWSYSIEDIKIDTSEWSEDEVEEYFDMKERSRKSYVSQWYRNIHEGRFFLFFKENDRFEISEYQRNGLDSYIKCICDVGERWQTAQDLLTIDGGGIGHKPGKHIEHIDDMFK
jgi:hypothetical protein